LRGGDVSDSEGHDGEGEEERAARARRKDADYLDEEEVMMLVQDIADQWSQSWAGQHQQQQSQSNDINRDISKDANGNETVPSSSGNDIASAQEGGLSSSDSKVAVPSGPPAIPRTTGMETLEREERERRRARVLTRRELILLLSVLPSRLKLQPQERHSGRICVGMLGYPNVGKSSAINTILGVSKSTHGKKY
jgi:large subunit GTPase 1